jgi:hypothetical protein
MKVTVEISEKELKEIMHFTGEKRKGAAIRQLAVESLMLRRRHKLLQGLDDGKWSVDYPTIAEMRKSRNVWEP